MKKLLIAGSLFFLFKNAHSQNVGIGIKKPANKLQVNGTFVVTEATNSTNTPPTAGQTYTMNNGGNIYFAPTDSTGRIYDPGGPGGNYVANLESDGRIGPGGTGVEFIIEDIDLGTGDSLLFFDFSYNRIFALSQSNQGIGSFRLTVNTQIDFKFKSNSDGSNGRGYANAGFVHLQITFLIVSKYRIEVLPASFKTPNLPV